MSDMEKQELLGDILNTIRGACSKVIDRAIADENFEDAAAIRDARDCLEEVIRVAMNNLPPS